MPTSFPLQGDCSSRCRILYFLVVCCSCVWSLALLLRWTADNRAGELGKVFIDRIPVIVERGRLQDDTGRARKHGQGENPQEQSVQHHSHELPILFHLHVVYRGKRKRAISKQWLKTRSGVVVKGNTLEIERREMRRENFQVQRAILFKMLDPQSSFVPPLPPPLRMGK